MLRRQLLTYRGVTASVAFLLGSLLLYRLEPLTWAWAAGAPPLVLGLALALGTQLQQWAAWHWSVTYLDCRSLATHLAAMYVTALLAFIYQDWPLVYPHRTLSSVGGVFWVIAVILSHLDAFGMLHPLHHGHMPPTALSELRVVTRSLAVLICIAIQGEVAATTRWVVLLAVFLHGYALYWQGRRAVKDGIPTDEDAKRLGWIAFSLYIIDSWRTIVSR